MSADRDVTRIVRSWLDEGVTRLPDRVLDAVLDQVPATRQRRALWPARRFREMNTPIKLLLAAAAVIIVAVVGFNVLPRQGGVGGPIQTAAPTSSPSPSPSPSTPPSPSHSAATIPDGPLAAGSYTTQPFVPDAYGLCAGQAGCAESSVDDSIGVTFTVPDGWTGIIGTIFRTDQGNSPPGGAGLMFSRGGWLFSKACNGGLTAPDVRTGSTVDEFVSALVDHPDLDVTTPVDVTLAGYSGKYLELQAPANIAADQDNPGPAKCAYYFVWEPGIYAQGPNHRWHIWVLDVDGTRVVVRSDTYPGTTPQVQAQLRAIVDSIRFDT
jgi:hypothetical protein